MYKVSNHVKPYYSLNADAGADNASSEPDHESDSSTSTWMSDGWQTRPNENGETVELNEREVERQQEQNIPVTDANVSNDRELWIVTDQMRRFRIEVKKKKAKNQTRAYSEMSTETIYVYKQEKIIWFNPPFNNSVKTNVGRKFLGLVKKNFPRNHRYHQIFNRNTLKLSYCCTSNLGNIIKQHNSQILKRTPAPQLQQCNCRTKRKINR